MDINDEKTLVVSKEDSEEFKRLDQYLDKQIPESFFLSRFEFRLFGQIYNYKKHYHFFQI